MRESEAYTQGYDARLQFFTETKMSGGSRWSIADTLTGPHNPFIEDPTLHRSWRHGWDDAVEAQREVRKPDIARFVRESVNLVAPLANLSLPAGWAN